MMNSDVVVIGGGLVGCATAYYLSKEGVNVTVVERNQLNRGASGQNAGSLHFQLEYRHLNALENSEQEAREYISYLLEAQSFWSTLEKELDEDIELLQHGGIMVAETKEEADQLQKKCKLENRWGLKTDFISGQEAREMAPYLSKEVRTALFSPNEGHANPRIVTLLFTKRSKEQGASFLTNTTVTNLEYTDKKWEVELNNKDVIRTDNVVLAGGPQMQQLAEMAGLYVPTFPVPLIMSVTEPVKPTIHHLVQHIGKRLTMKQVRDGNVIIGGGWSGKFSKTKGKFNYNMSPLVPLESLKGNVKVASDIVPSIKNIRLLRSWSGVAGFNVDQLSLLGEFPERKGLYTGGGDGSFTYGPLHGKILSELILNNKTDYSIRAFNPKKISHLNMFMP